MPRIGDVRAPGERLRRTIRNYAASLGQPDRYHETITVAYVALIQQHICERGDGGGWEAFARDNPELFQPGLLLRFYPQTQLESERCVRTNLASVRGLLSGWLSIPGRATAPRWCHGAARQ